MLGGHGVEVLDDNIPDAARGQSDPDDLVGPKRVHVNLNDGLVADDEDAVGAELQHLFADGCDRARWIFDQELHVVRAFPRRRLRH